ncbi:MAG TPA: DUF4384 domain-containing protein [bacterium]
MNAILLVLSLIASLNPAGDPSGAGGSPATLSSSDGIELWVNNGDLTYQTGDKLKIYFRVPYDCYVAVYDIEVSGERSRLFPSADDEEEGWVKAGRVYELPSPDDNFEYEVNGPGGTETIVLLVSTKDVPEYESDEAVTDDVVRRSLELNIREPEPVLLRIVSNPKKCRIYIENVGTGDEEYVGKAPYTIELKPGEYVVRIRKTWYRTLTRRIYLEPGEHRRVFVKLWEE